MTPIHRSPGGFLKSAPKPVEPALVREAPQLVRRGTELTDGESGYRVVDHHRRVGVDHYRLVNVERPELSDQPPRHGWFSIDEMGELAFGRGEQRAQRSDFG